MFRNANNNFFAFVCNNQAITEKATGTVISASNMSDGEVVLVDRDNHALDPSAAITGTTRFKIATRANGKVFYSPLINFADCTISAGLAANAVNQVTTIGSNGTTTIGLAEFGIADDTAAAAAVGDSYYVLIEKQDNDEANRSGYHPAITAQVKLTNPNGHTNAELIHVRLAEQLREAIRRNDQLEASTPSARGSKYVAAKVLGVGLGALDATTTENATLTFGSPTVTFAGAPAAAAQVAGNFLLIGFGLYRIASYASNVVTLDFPFAGVSGTYTANATAAATTIGVLSEANVIAATGVGLELTGVAQHSFDVNRERKWSVSRFDVRFAKNGENVGAPITTGTTADEGLGEYQQVALEEYESFGALGQRWVSDVPAAFRSQNTVTDGSRIYGLISIREVTTKQNSLIGSTIGKTTYHIWLELDGNDAATDELEAAADTQDAILTQLGVTATDVATSGQV
jgi:hypothetical protein